MPRNISLRYPPDTYARIDEADYPAVSVYSWTRNNKGYAVHFGNGQIISMHRFITDAGPGEEVDHIDGDRLNNTRANLRLVTRSQNLQNRKMTSASGYKGVHRARGRYAAVITVKMRGKHLGHFDDAQLAAKVYDVAARHFYGAKARTNFPGEDPEARQLFEDYLRRQHEKTIVIPKGQSPYRGVYWERGRWRAKLGVKGRRLHLGYFLTQEEAARAYDAAAREHHGEKARLNFPLGEGEL